ncbi:Undecaprenyl-phosphate 4-deoxy-4-formamido-L-arabinose transferase [Limihaloglobus sulfuriphilus]|uniref:dolichyl-phosphate beta-glucosyltransferase n=1 Tax=Limihaloglobus sulfuriphilus TaxID=1851148 RepID=A0A1Q2MG51_9BACT|nr:dolichyl-phosphate beta-glucosyltransferase [Limihaloglobus sulfuriphilus]AQQ71661.1 Undecaprenyl-phosphate 4-deoxy-4-formamido-L-arabinose transferase [Limihaloglobus sulfuriphilus]
MQAKLSIIIPAYNESDRIVRTVSELLEFAAANPAVNLTEVIVVCDGCSDNTEEKVKTSIDSSIVSTISYAKNQGKGFAVRTGVLAAKGEIIGFMDADGSTSLEEIPLFTQILTESRADVVIGSRSLPESNITRRQPFYRWLLGKCFYLCTLWIDHLPYHDTQCGFKFFTADAARSLFEPLISKGFEFDIEILVRAAHLGLKIQEKPVTWHNDPRSSVSVIRDGFKTLISLWKFRRI